MSRLGAFLEIVFGPTDRFETLQATIRHWRNQEAATNVRDRPQIGRRKPQNVPADAIDESTLSAWVKLPDRFRVEESRRTSDGIEETINIINGKQSWRIDHEGHVETATEERREVARNSDVDRHFNRYLLREFFNGLNLTLIGDCRAANQECIQIRAVPRPNALLWPHWLPHGADEYEFHVDPARGLLLGIIARTAGKVFEVNEVTDVQFDRPLDNSLFTHTAEIGEQTVERGPITEHLALEAAILRVPFKVYVPTRVADPTHSRLEVIYHPARMRSPRASLMFMYRGSTEYDSLWIQQAGSARPDLDELEWEPLKDKGMNLQISDPGTEGRRIVTFDREGTYVEIISDLDRERLLDLATSFVPAGNTAT
jgi:hypothetical protein